MGYYFLVIGASILLFALWAFAQSILLLVRGTRVRGVITGVDEQMRRGNSEYKKVYFHPVIEFTTPEGHPFQFTFGSGSTRKRPVIGTEVSVVYPKDSPSKATLVSFMGLWAGPLGAAILGGGCLFGGVRIVFFDD